MVRIAVTGTPGVGKTSLARLAASAGWRVVDVGAWAREEGCIVGHDDEDASDIVDTDALARRMPPDDGSRVLYDGHLSHLLPVDEAWVLRCDPAVLRRRLEARGYPASKVRENLEAEAIDLILQEAIDHVGRVMQRDGTHRSPEELFMTFSKPDRTRMNDIEPVDWSDHLPI